MPACAGLGFPEFTRFFNHSRLWKLQHPFTAGCSAIELLRSKAVKILKSLSGREGDRTPDLRIANAALSQLSYPPQHD